MSITTAGITRQELAGYLRETFDLFGLVDCDGLLTALEHQGAPKEASDLIAARVPDGVRMTEMRNLWQYLPDVPVHRSSP